MIDHKPEALQVGMLGGFIEEGLTTERPAARYASGCEIGRDGPNPATPSERNEGYDVR